MPKLKSYKHELFANNYIKNKGNQTHAYAQTYPDSSNSAANTNGSRLISNDNVKNRIQEILERKEGSRISVLVQDLINKKTANKTIIIDKELKEVADNPSQLESIKTLLKLHGLLSTNQASVTDARSVSFNINIEGIQDLKEIVNSLRGIRLRDDKISGRIE